MRIDTQLRAPLAGAADEARALCDAGFEGVFTFEGPHDVFLPLAAAAAVGGIDLYTNLAIALPRSPTHLAHTAYDLHEASGGRFALGLGTQVRPHIEKRYGATWSKPVARMRELIEATRAVLTCWQEGSRLDVQPGYGRSLICALARLGGRPVAIVANDPSVRAGTIDRDAAIKGADFLTSVGAFGLPVVFLADNPGVLAGTKAERDGILKWAGRMFQAERRLTGPKVHVTLRKAFGFGSTVMGHNPFDHQTATFAFPGVTMSAMPAGPGGASAGLDDDAQARVEAAQAGGPWAMAGAMRVDEVIDPRDLRNAVLAALHLARPH